MMTASDEILRKLKELGIPFTLVCHPLAQTMEDLKGVEQELGALIPKNLFLTPRNRSALYLCLVRPDYPFRTADISKQIGSSRLSFGTPEQMEAALHTHPGAVSPLGLLFESAREVRLVVDRRLLSEPFLGFHPNDNNKTLSMRTEDFFHRFLPATGHPVTWVLPGEMDPA
ncbi:MAG: prolyl-tRNA synthetase associated domain-containing protein [Candidatus Excrementavichristensenella sp.]|jgi:Ala-tRNA(Pro) deacylase